MSRFSKAEAEARGWAIVHGREERQVPTAAGEFRVIPGSYRAEKYLPDGTLINEEGETVGLLLERISAKESQIESLDRKTTEAVIPEDIPRDEAGIEQRHVLVPAEPGNLNDDAPAVYISDAELTSRSRTDAVVELVDGEPQMVFYRGTDAALDADKAHEEQSAAVEAARTAELDVGSTKQVEIDDSQTVVDTPGGATGSVLIVREDEDTIEDVIERRDSENEIDESDRVARQLEIGFNPAPEDADKLAGVGASIRSRDALGTEVPRQGETHDAAEAILNPPEDVEPADTEPATAELSEARQEAQEDKAEELTAEQGAEADKPEVAQEVLAAGTDAEQKIADDQAGGDESEAAPVSASFVAPEPQSGTAESTESQEPSQPEATRAAVELAEEEDVELSEIAGTGADGRVTKPDVEKHLEDKSAEGDSSATS